MLKAVVSDINGVDEAYRGLYAEKDGKFYLQVQGSDGYALENVEGLKSALSGERTQKAQLETRLNAYNGIDADAARQALDKVKDLGDLDPKAAREAITTAERLSKLDPEKEADRLANEKFERSRTQLKDAFDRKETEYTLRIKELETVADRRSKQVEQLLKSDRIKAELSRVKALDEARDIIEIAANRDIRVREVDGKSVLEVLDAAGNVREKDPVNRVPYTVEDYFTEMREKRPALFQADQKTGIGITPNTQTKPTGGQVNPWMKDHFNRTEQGRITIKNPELAKQLKAQAGVA